MFRGRAGYLVSRCKRASSGRDSVDIDGACPIRVLENLRLADPGANWFAVNCLAKIAIGRWGTAARR